MPFYGGNIVYKTEVDVPESTLKICVSRYRGALTKVLIDGKEIGRTSGYQEFDEFENFMLSTIKKVGV